MTDLDTLLRLHQAATPGPYWIEPEWKDRQGKHHDAYIAYGEQGNPHETYDLYDAYRVETDYAYLVAAANAAPGLVAVRDAAMHAVFAWESGDVLYLAHHMNKLHDALDAARAGTDGEDV